MPLVKRTVEPVEISRVAVSKVCHNELEYIANATLTNIVRQLGSLSAHAEDLFTELHRETCYVLSRSVQLNQRVDRLKVKITQLNPTVETGTSVPFQLILKLIVSVQILIVIHLCVLSFWL